MTRMRLRPAYSDEALATIYPQPHEHGRWSDHRLRVETTIGVGKWFLERAAVTSGADLSCGDGWILEHMPVQKRYFGDFAPGYKICGPIEKTLEQIPHVDLFVCSETIEHLDDPAAVLGDIRVKTDHLLLSTPIECWGDSNPEHYWAWSRADVEEMLTDAGFRVMMYCALDFRPLGMPYCFGIWGAS